MQAIWNNLCDEILCDFRFFYERTFSRPKSTSASPPKADVFGASADFRC